ncbi:MAG: MMPL family transporter [Oceanicoccus sp.]
MKHRFFEFYQLLVLRKPLVALLVTVGFIGWLATNIPNFKLDASADSLVLEGDESLKYYREISKNYLAEDFLLVTYQPQDDLLSDQVLETIDALRSELLMLEGVSSVTSILDVPLLESPKVELDDIANGGLRSLRTPGIDKKLVLKELTTSPIYKSLLTSADGKTTALQVNLQRDERYNELLTQRENLRELQSAGSLSSLQLNELAELEVEFREYANVFNERQNKLVDDTRDVIAKYRGDAVVFLGGVPMIAADMISFVKSDLVVFGAGIAGFIILIMSIIFRHLVWVLLPLATCILSASFMLGLITLMDWRMTVISSNFVALLLIITLSITIHLVVRYRELLASNPELDQRELVRRTTMFMIKPCVYTALTTIVAFASLVVSGIRPVIDFGWMMTIGVTAALIIAFIVLPAGLLLLPRPKRGETTAAGDPFTVYFAKFTEHHGTVIVSVTVVLIAASIFGISRLEVENRFIDYFHEDTEIYQGMEIIDAQLGGTIPLEVIIDADLISDNEFIDGTGALQTVDINASNEEFDEEFGSDFGDEFGDDFVDDFAEEAGEDGIVVKPSYWFNKAGLNRIEQVHDYLDSLDETGKVMSLAMPYKALRNLTTGIDDIQLALIQRSLPDDINSILISPYLNEEADQTRITVRVMETSHTLRRADLLEDVQHHLVDELGFKPEQIHLTGMLVLYNNMLQSLYKSQILTIGAVFVAIVLMFLVLFRSLSLALIAIAPNLLSAGVVLGSMGLIGIPLDIMTVTIAAITIGIAVDDTIHYIYRFRAEFPKDRNYLATMYRCHTSIGKAMFYTSIIIIVGFSILALSNFNPSIYFGLLTGAAMFTALIGALLLLPTLLIYFKPLGPEADDTGNISN